MTRLETVATVVGVADTDDVAGVAISGIIDLVLAVVVALVVLVAVEILVEIWTIVQW